MIMFPLTLVAPSAALSFMRVSWLSIMGAGRQEDKGGCDGPEPMSLYGYHWSVWKGLIGSCTLLL